MGDAVASDAEKPPVRGEKHEALAVFVGEWKAEGVSYGGTEQPKEHPKRNGVAWASTHTGRWHTGEFFLIQDEKALLGGGQVLDTFSFMGVDAETGEYFARSFENHGFYRHYDVSTDGNVWTMTGNHERARIEFTDERTQVIVWEWKPDNEWLPLCDRTAVRTD